MLMEVQSKDNTVVILAGGYGSRLGEYTEKIPKPLVKIGNDPIIAHIMRLWAIAGFRNFIILGGYGVDKLVEMFEAEKYDKLLNLDVTVSVFDTGLNTATAGRIKQVQHQLTDDFFVCYGDGLTSYPLELLDDYTNFNKSAHGSLCTMLVTHPTGRFGDVKFSDGLVTEFSEKQMEDKWINAGFFGMNKRILDYISSEDDVLETDVFSKLVKDRKLYALPNQDNEFWHCMDTPKDLKELNKMWESGDAPWKIW